MDDLLQNKLQSAGILYRFVGIFGGLFEFFVVFTVINFIPIFIFKNENDKVFFVLFLISIILYLIYVLTIQTKYGRTFTQKKLKIYLVTTDGGVAQFSNIIKRFFSKIIVLLIWVIPVSCIVLIIEIFFLQNYHTTTYSFFKMLAFFYFISFPILMIPIIADRQQTLYDYLSRTLVLVDYKTIKKEEREHFRELIKDPFQINRENPNVSIWARLIAIIIFIILKIFRRNK